MLLESKIHVKDENLQELEEALKLQKKIAEKLYTQVKFLKAKAKHDSKEQALSEDDTKPATKPMGAIPKKACKPDVDLFAESTSNKDEQSSQESGQESTDSNTD